MSLKLDWKHSALVVVMTAAVSAQVSHLVAEYEARNAPIKLLFDKQFEAAEDPARFKAIRTPRRAGKTTTIICRFLAQGLRYPNSRFPYIMLTRGQAKDVAWPTLKEIAYKLNLDIKFNETELYAVLAKGS